MTDEINRKLIATKEQWARDGRGLTGATADPALDRLPPGQHTVKTWPVLDLGVQPRIDPRLWRLTVDGLVENPVVWKADDIAAQPQAESVSDIHCVTTWSRYDNRWRGIAARHLLSVVRPAPEARFVLFQSYDTYTTNIPLAAFDDADVLLATHWEGEPLTLDHGGPLRAVVPKLYFWKSAKWVKRITFAAEDRPGYWEVRGYHNDADPWKEERYADDADPLI
ncbi:sulfite oxidase-like oxidoreductase [Azospirillum halopraeferens]|uniref:sulfite oxidase-like oxidoreductase n=1 Tax=Azospirillum halopraeferens TaxID=34010 RepID=UPI000407E578|nr:sulfite oxidase-like oxidoreductase [Azospirillum halopraeferens]